ncbi:DUF3426 domain-containing protein [Polaromonas sp. YR568]|uniref:DUF3426 domain-containing protein n=1 Tax=Polaromonas sp. YR568 TaxID=1855301 RepID=UPI00398BC05C
MSLITRCPACGTMFKVVTDQLKVSQGWVRCGHCTEVFDASVHLLPRDMSSLTAPAPLLPDTDTAPVPLPAFDAPTEPQSLPPAEPPPAPSQQEWAPARSFADRVPLRPSSPGSDDAQDSAADFDPARWKRVQQERQHDPLDLPAESLPDVPPPRQPAMLREAIEDDSSFAYSDVDSGMPGRPMEHDVSFVRDARRKAFWRRPLTRWSLALLSLLLLATLVAQWAVQQRNTLAALEPRLLPALQALCGPLHCEIRPPRHIEALVIDSSTFNRIGPDAYRLSFTLKNTGVTVLEMPSLEVTLTDTQDQAVVRRILAPAQFGARGPTLAAQSELAGLVIMKVSGDAGVSTSSPSPASPSLRVAGYRVLAFYP